MKKNILLLTSTLLAGTVLTTSCNNFLDEPMSKTTAIEVKTADQLDALLGNFNDFYEVGNPTAVFSTDDYEVSKKMYDANKTRRYANLTQIQYATWDVNGVATNLREGFWSGEYQKIFTANMVLNYIDKVSGSDEQKQELVAEAHLIRAYSYMELVNNYCLYYTGDNGNEPGLPLKQSVSFEELSSRNTLGETNSLIEKDLEAAAAIRTPLVKSGKVRSWRGNTGAVNAISARYWLTRNNYDKALEFADKALSEYHTLVDYNTEMHYSTKKSTYNIKDAATGTDKTVEVLYPYTHDNQTDMSDMIGWKEFYYFRLLYNEYWWYAPSEALLAIYRENPNDLRYKYHIVEGYSYDRGMTDPAYDYPGYVFFYKDRMPEGPTVAEMYLIKAECLARKNDISGAMQALNTLRKARIASENYTDETATNQEDAIRKILKERRREMPFAARWIDIKRYNHNDDPNDDVEMTRQFYPYTDAAILDGEQPIEYKLPKDSRRFAAPIPATEVTSSNGEIKQNTY